MSEADFQSFVMDLAMLRGWDALHVAKCPGRVGTPTRGSLAKGWPDLFLMRGSESIFVELKTDKKYPTPIQREVHDKLRKAGFRVEVWRPRDEAVIRKVL